MSLSLTKLRPPSARRGEARAVERHSSGPLRKKSLFKPVAGCRDLARTLCRELALSQGLAREGDSKRKVGWPGQVQARLSTRPKPRTMGAKRKTDVREPAGRYAQTSSELESERAMGG